MRVALQLGGLGIWAFVDYMNVMCNAIFLDERLPLTFMPQSWRVRDGSVTFETYWTDCNLLFARVAAFIFIVLAFMVRLCIHVARSNHDFQLCHRRGSMRPDGVF